MDFEEIDFVLGDSVTVGDIVLEDGEFHQIRRFDEDEMTHLVFDTYNLSTGDEDALIVNPALSYTIYRSY